ncbi:MAG: tRNA lysidine(34) synthetase TilS [Planctomycetota bacterium]|jgi:tRNA(Ile)-lysidine synthase|nr:tRNA lysidine(34) synthetase TilS [Planctomycetota bacterium]
MFESFSNAMERITSLAGRPNRIVAALSGGRDSVVLLHLLRLWRDRLPAPPALSAAHLNHGLRGEAARDDREFCRRLAEKLGLDFACRDADAAGTAREERLNLEEAGRLLRHRFFAELSASEPTLILTGHHADDQAETILLHRRRGAHRRGLAGMRELSFPPIPGGAGLRIGRPLLRFTRREITAYAFSQALEWREDASNQDLSLARNRLRHRTLPFLEKLLPGFRERLLARAETLAGEEEELAGLGRELAASRSWREAGGRFFQLDAAAFAHPERLAYAFRQLWEEETGTRLPSEATLSRLAQLAKNETPGQTLTLPGRLRARRELDGIFFFFPDASDARPAGEIILPRPPFALRAAGLDIQAEWLAISGLPPAADRRDPEVEWLNPVGIRWPLGLRPPRPGERFRPLGAPGSRKIQDMLVDLKIPRRRRLQPIVLADEEGPLWLWPCRLAQRARLDGAGPIQALRLSIRNAAPEGK